MEAAIKRRVVSLTFAIPAFFALLLFVPAGTIAWGTGWLFVGVFLLLDILVVLYVWRTNPELLDARSRPHKGTKRWDKILLCFFAPSMMAIFPVAGLDAGRFHWSCVPGWGCLLGYIMLIAGMAISAWAGGVNKFAEPTVRIQTDRGHKVIDSGPYAIVRHPGYSAVFFWLFGIALALRSLWALVPAVIACLLLVVRTRWEDRTLQQELEGYKEYAERVRYKLVPAVW